ncbi:MAG TPA: response regulator [Vicinamibacterales bacterium]|nr:response regulator [Vicinamibacterales bacterium]
MPEGTVLLVDDDRDTLALYGLILETFGFDVLPAENGCSALRVAAEHRPDIVVTDLAMPVMDGVELCARLRSDPSMSGIPILAVSGQAWNGTDEQARQAGCDEVLLKPCLPDRLVEAVGRLLGGRREYLVRPT